MIEKVQAPVEVQVTEKLQYVVDVSETPVRDLDFRIGVSIKFLRLALKLTQDNLASKVGISQEAISMIEGDVRSVNLKTLEKISLALGFSLSKLIEIAEDPRSPSEFFEETINSLSEQTAPQSEYT